MTVPPTVVTDWYAKTRKNAKYKDDVEAVQDQTFIPVVFNELGGFNIEGRQFIGKMAMNVAMRTGIPASVAMRRLMERISVTIAKMQFLSILDRQHRRHSVDMPSSDIYDNDVSLLAVG